MDKSQASRFMKVAKELGSNATTLSDLPFTTLYEIATLPQEEREKEHVTSKGETKTVDEMTVRELKEVKCGHLTKAFKGSYRCLTSI